jgi:hypothetical protein
MTRFAHPTVTSTEDIAAPSSPRLQPLHNRLQPWTVKITKPKQAHKHPLIDLPAYATSGVLHISGLRFGGPGSGRFSSFYEAAILALDQSRTIVGVGFEQRCHFSWRAFGRLIARLHQAAPSPLHKMDFREPD